MNFSQKLGLFILIIVTIAYIYFSFFNQNDFNFDFNKRNENTESNYLPEILPIEAPSENETEVVKEPEKKSIKIFVCDSKGKIRSVNRECDTSKEKSCFAYSIAELIKAPTNWEKSKGFTSEIPVGTKILSIREGEGSAMIDLSSTFETGGGAESTYIRVKQIIKTAKANTNLPVYLYIEGKQANVIGGEGIMIKQPLNERSLDE